MAIYMKFGDVKGEVTEDKHKGWIELNSFQFGVGRAVSSGAGGANARKHGAKHQRDRRNQSERRLVSQALRGLVGRGLRYGGHDRDDPDDQKRD